MRVQAHAIRIDLPAGWDGRIVSNQGAPADLRAAGVSRVGAGHARPVTMQAGNFALPPGDGDFGTKATGAMRTDGVFITLTEYLVGAGLAPGRGLFASDSIPRALAPSHFSHRTLLLGRRGQAGFQHFFSAHERPFCLYVVLGSQQRADRLVGEANRVLGTLRIEPRASA